MGRDAAGVTLDAFGIDVSRPMMFFTEAARGLDEPSMAVCEGLYSRFHGGRAPAGRVNGSVIAEAEAEHLRA